MIQICLSFVLHALKTIPFFHYVFLFFFLILKNLKEKFLICAKQKMMNFDAIKTVLPIEFISLGRIRFYQDHRHFRLETLSETFCVCSSTCMEESPLISVNFCVVLLIKRNPHTAFPVTSTDGMSLLVQYLCTEIERNHSAFPTLDQRQS